MVYPDLAQVDACGARRVERDNLDEDPQAQTRISYWLDAKCTLSCLHAPMPRWIVGEEVAFVRQGRSVLTANGRVAPPWAGAKSRESATSRHLEPNWLRGNKKVAKKYICTYIHICT